MEVPEDQRDMVREETDARQTPGRLEARAALL